MKPNDKKFVDGDVFLRNLAAELWILDLFRCLTAGLDLDGMGAEAKCEARMLLKDITSVCIDIRLGFTEAVSEINRLRSARDAFARRVSKRDAALLCPTEDEDCLSRACCGLDYILGLKREGNRGMNMSVARDYIRQWIALEEPKLGRSTAEVMLPYVLPGIKWLKFIICE